MTLVRPVEGNLRKTFNDIFSESLKEQETSEFLGINNWREYLDAIISQEDNEGLFLILNDDNPAGYIVATLNEPDFIYLSSIYVVPKHRGKGVCQNALKEVMKFFKVSHLHAYVHENNYLMQRVLRKMGASDDGKWMDFKL